MRSVPAAFGESYPSMGGGDSQTAVTKVLIRIWLKGGERRVENIARRTAPLWTGAWRKSSLLSEVKLKRHREQIL